ncbi:MAG: flagellar biosynthetic protein FliO [Pirellulaceae bacterium]
MRIKSLTIPSLMLLAASWLLISIAWTPPLSAQFPGLESGSEQPPRGHVSRPIQPPREKSAASSTSASVSESTRQAVIRVSASMAIVLAVFFLVIWFLRRSLPHQARVLPEEAFEVLGTAPLSSRHTIQLVRVGNRLLVVSLTTGGATSLAEISDIEEVDRLLSLCQAGRQQDQARAGGESFQQVLSEMGIDRTGTHAARHAS